MTAPTYTYVLCDLLTDFQRAVLPLKGVSFEDRIGRAGSLQASLDMPNARTIALGKLVQANAGRAALWVYRDHPTTGRRLWWGGIVWSAVPSRSDRGAITLSIGAATFWSYAHHRTCRTNTFTQVDQATIVRTLWGMTRTNFGDSGDIGVRNRDSFNLHGMLRDRVYYETDAVSVGQRLEELGDVIGGPEVWVMVDTDTTGKRRKTLLNEVRIGSPEPVTVFTSSEHGGTITSWSEPTDATNAGTTFRARGAAPESDAGTEQRPLLSTKVTAGDLIGRGWPLLDVMTDHSDVTDPATLDAYALQNLADRAGQITTSSATVRVESTDWRPQLLGSNVRMRWNDAWHTPSSDRIVRPVAYKCTPSGRDGQERVELIYDERGE